MSVTQQMVRLTALSHGAGCACKLSLDELTGLLGRVALGQHPDLVVGAGTGDDAAVWRQRDGRLLVATTDFFTPLVDDPFTWGQIAAANAVSDVYAMGAEPRFALNLVGWPRDLDFGLLEQVLAGATSVADKAGYPLVGGHTIDSAEPLYGQAVIGEVGERNLLTNAGARPGQALVLTKPIGTGIAVTAAKRSDPEAVEADTPLGRAFRAAVASMIRLNRCASQVATEFHATAATDVTGFGLLGHLHRLAAASGVTCQLDSARVPLLPGVEALVDEGFVPGGTRRNVEQSARFVRGSVDLPTRTLLCDAQTSGGLLIACAERDAPAVHAVLGSRGHDAAIIGAVLPADSTTGEPGTIHLGALPA